MVELSVSTNTSPKDESTTAIGRHYPPGPGLRDSVTILPTQRGYPDSGTQGHGGQIATPLTSPRAGARGSVHAQVGPPGPRCCWPSRVSGTAAPSVCWWTRWPPATTWPSTTKWPSSSLAPTPWPASSREAGTPVHDLGAHSNLDLRWLMAFRRLLLEHGYAIVHFHLPYTAALGRLVVAHAPPSPPAGDRLHRAQSLEQGLTPGQAASTGPRSGATAP